MNAAAQDENRSPDPDAGPEEPSYQALCYPALLTLGLGALSILALTTPALWIIPVVAVAVGAIALRSLAQNPERIGRRAALTGMVLAVLFGTSAWAARASRDVWLGHVARTYTDQWIGLIKQQRLHEAHQLHGRKVERAAAGLDLADFYRDQEGARAEYQQFFGAEPLRTIVQVAPEGKIEFDRVERCLELPQADQVILRYVAHFEQGGHPRTLAVRIILKRERSDDSSNRDWYVEAVRAV